MNVDDLQRELEHFYMVMMFVYWRVEHINIISDLSHHNIGIIGYWQSHRRAAFEFLI